MTTRNQPQKLTNRPKFDFTDTLIDPPQNDYRTDAEKIEKFIKRKTDWQDYSCFEDAKNSIPGNFGESVFMNSGNDQIDELQRPRSAGKAKIHQEILRRYRKNTAKIQKKKRKNVRLQKQLLTNLLRCTYRLIAK